MPSETPRDTAAIVALFQQAHNKIVALRRLDDQIAALVMQHEVLQQDVRAIQARINEEFERVIKFNQAPGKIPDRYAGTLPGEPPATAAAAEHANGNGHPAAPLPTTTPNPLADDDTGRKADTEADADAGSGSPQADSEPVRVPIRRSVPAPSLTGPILEHPARPAGFPS